MTSAQVGVLYGVLTVPVACAGVLWFALVKGSAQKGSKKETAQNVMHGASALATLAFAWTAYGLLYREWTLSSAAIPLAPIAVGVAAYRVIANMH